jgi:DNA helicase-2/ATP-dependent DNA helicase PcrA
MKLNTQQEAAANHRDGPCLVIAVPGSGKTRLLVERVGRLIDSGVPANGIVCVTFTNKTAQEMKERVCKRLNVHNPKCFVGTFHRLCLLLLKKFGERLGYSDKFTIIDSDDQKDMVSSISRQLNKKLEKNEIPIVVKAVNDFRENQWSRSQLDDALQNNDDWIHIADEYIDRLRKDNCVDFSGMLSESIRLLKEHKDVLERVQNSFKYLQVDEIQDTNYAQFILINLFIGKWKNILMVGDISQSIYKFRGARYQNILDFLKQYPDCVRIELPLNYRSTPQIVACADKLIKNNSSHLAEKFESVNPSGEDVRCLQFNNQFEEADFVARHVEKLKRDGGWNPSDIAVLYRMNSMSEPIERAMAGKGVPYKVVGGKSFYDRREVKDMLALLRFHSNKKDGIAFHRVAGLVKGVGDVTVGKIEKIVQDDDVDVIEAAHRFCDSIKLSKVKEGILGLVSKFEFENPPEAVQEVLTELVKRFDYEEMLKEEYGPEDGMDRIQNVNALIQSAARYADENSDKSAAGYLQMVTLLTSADKEKDITAEGGRVSLMSIHAAKGLEFPVVFVVGCEQNILPHGLAVQEDPFEGLEEERRLCYVAFTRAKTLLITTYNRNRSMFGQGGSKYNKPVKPSQFLKEAGLLKEYEMARMGR